MTAVDYYFRPDQHPPEVVVPAFHPVDSLDLLEFVVESSAEVDLSALSEAELIDRIARLERLHNRVAAVESDTVYTFARRHAATQTASGVVAPRNSNPRNSNAASPHRWDWPAGSHPPRAVSGYGWHATSVTVTTTCWNCSPPAS